MSNYYLGQGKLYIAARSAAGLPMPLRWLGDVSDAKLALKVDNVEHKESYTGQRLTAKKIVTGKEASFDFTLMELSKDNLSLALYGKASTIASGSVTAEVLPADLVADDRVALKYPKVSTVVITDSTPTTPLTLDPSKYTVDADYGTITLLDVTAVVQPLNVAYTHAALENVSIFTASQSEVFLRYEGINLAEDGAPVIVELYKVSTEPLKELALITTKFAETAIASTVLLDSARPVDDEIGQFGRILQVAAV
ncbi:MAG: hypothetical protein GZ090_01415 [Oxalobacteraceae bacterium]|nr:hypothetical protein [Oxalobacteraceae bacterium]